MGPVDEARGPRGERWSGGSTDTRGHEWARRCAHWADAGRRWTERKRQCGDLPRLLFVGVTDFSTRCRGVTIYAAAGDKLCHPILGRSHQCVRRSLAWCGRGALDEVDRLASWRSSYLARTRTDVDERSEFGGWLIDLSGAHTFHRIGVLCRACARLFLVL